MKEHIFNEERRDQILHLLSKNKKLFVNDLCKIFKTSPVTIRNDLNVLERNGLLKRVHGGAIINKALFQGLVLQEKEKLQRNEKKRISIEAAKLISKGDVIVIESGSTTVQLAKRIKKIEKLTVITNALTVVNELMDSECQIILTGGVLDKKNSTLYGRLSEELFESLTANKLFQGVDGIDLEIGLTTPSIVEAHNSRVMMKASSENIVLADSSKFGRRSLGIICKINEIDKIITDDKIKPEYVKQIENMGIEVIIA